MAWKASATDTSFLTPETALVPHSKLVVEVTYKSITDTVLVGLGSAPTVEAILATPTKLHAIASRKFKSYHELHPSAKCSSKIVGFAE